MEAPQTRVLLKSRFIAGLAEYEARGLSPDLFITIVRTICYSQLLACVFLIDRGLRTVVYSIGRPFSWIGPLFA